MRIADLAEFNAVREAGLAKLTPDRPRIAVGMGTCGTGNGAEGVYSAFKSAIEARGLDVALAPGRLLRLLRRGAARQRLGARLAPAHAAPGPARARGPHPRGHRARRAARPPISSCARSRSGTTSPATCATAAATRRSRPGTQSPSSRASSRSSCATAASSAPTTSRSTSRVGGYQALYKVLIDGNPAAVIE